MIRVRRKARKLQLIKGMNMRSMMSLQRGKVIWYFYARPNMLYPNIPRLPVSECLERVQSFYFVIESGENQLLACVISSWYSSAVIAGGI
jgi:hypothetical protein